MRHPLQEWAWKDRRKMKWVCAKIGVSYTAMYAWQKRKACPSAHNMKAIEVLTGGAVSPSDCINYFLGEGE